MYQNVLYTYPHVCIASPIINIQPECYICDLAATSFHLTQNHAFVFLSAPAAGGFFPPNFSFPSRALVYILSSGCKVLDISGFFSSFTSQIKCHFLRELLFSLFNQGYPPKPHFIYSTFYLCSSLFSLPLLLAKTVRSMRAEIFLWLPLNFQSQVQPGTYVKINK